MKKVSRKILEFKDKLKIILSPKIAKGNNYDYYESAEMQEKPEQVFDDHYYQDLLRINRMPSAGTLDNKTARKWYHYYLAKIPESIDKTVSLAEQARQAHQLRNWIREKTRELMADRDLALQLEQAEPNLTLEQVRQKQIKKGLSYYDLTWEGVIRNSTKSRTSVDEQLGVDSFKNELEINPLWRPYVKTPRSRDEAFEKSILDKKDIDKISLSDYEKRTKEERKKKNVAQKKNRKKEKSGN